MAKKKGPEMYEGKPVLVAADSDKLVEAVEKFKAAYPDIPLEAPYVVRVKGKKVKKKAFCEDSTIGVAILHDNVEVLGGSAFDGCTSLTSINIPDSVTEIGWSVFDGCTGLTSITIPDSVTEIGYGAFKGCGGLSGIVVAEGNMKYDSRNNCNAIIETATNELLRGCSATVIPDSVTKIGGGAFAGCTGLTSITIPASVTVIEGCAFSGCTGLTSINIPDSVTVIERETFSGCTGLTSITIPASVTVIGVEAFKGCTGLTSITIPDSVTKIGSYAFDGCGGLSGIVVAEGNMKYDSRNNCNAIIETATNELLRGCSATVIPDSVTEIGSDAFDGCSGLTSIIIPDSVTEIGSHAFDGCSGLTSINIPDSVTKIGGRAFKDCTGLTSITIPASVTEIDSNVFCGCSGLSSIVIPASVTKIGRQAFRCSGLTSINIPASVTEIDESAFESCNSLTSIVVAEDNPTYDSRDNCNAIINTKWNNLRIGCSATVIPDSVTKIGSNAFKDCTGLSSITIPASVTAIGDSAFEGCTGLTSITIPDSVTAIGDSAFEGCTGLTSIEIPDSVTEIRFDAFRGCTGLKSIVIPNSVQKIWSAAFLGCAGLKSIVIPNSVTFISEVAFEGCSGLTSITIPDSVTEIGTNYFGGTFSNCTGLTSITIPDSVTFIGEETFSGCTGLKEISVKSVTLLNGTDLPSDVKVIERGEIKQKNMAKRIITLEATGGRDSRLISIYDLSELDEAARAEADNLVGKELHSFCYNNLKPVSEYFIQGFERGLCIHVKDEDDNVLYDEETEDFNCHSDEWATVEAGDEYAQKYVDFIRKKCAEYASSHEDGQMDEDDYISLESKIADAVINDQMGYKHGVEWCKEGHKLFAHTSDLYAIGAYTCDIELEEGEDFDPEKLVFLTSDYDGQFPYCIDSIVPLVKYGNKIYTMVQNEWEEHYGYNHFVEAQEDEYGSNWQLYLEFEDC